jgi:regulator of replication initiation timing
MTATIQKFIKNRSKDEENTALAIALGTVDFLKADGRFIIKATTDEVVMPLVVYDREKAAQRIEALGSLRGLKAFYEEIKSTATDPNHSKNILAKLDATIVYMVGAIEKDKALAAAGELENGEILNDKPSTSEGDTPLRRSKAKPTEKKCRLSTSQRTARKLKRALIKLSRAGPATKKAKADKPSYAEAIDPETAKAIAAAKTESRLDAVAEAVSGLANAAINSSEEQTTLRKEQGELREQIQEVKESTEYLHDKVDEVRADAKNVTDALEELKAGHDSLHDMLHYYLERLPNAQAYLADAQQTYMAPDVDMATEGMPPPTPSTQASLGIAKPLFPKYSASTDIDIYFDSVERYFRLCGTDEKHHIDYTLLAIPQFSTWWQAHVTAHPLDAHSWDNFKATIKQFLMKEDPHTAAMGKLLRLKQNDMSVADYCTRFMQLVRDSNCQPTDQWLPVHLLQNMNDTSLIRAASSNNGQKWHNITDLVQHLNAITALRPSFTARNNGRQGTDRNQRGRGAGQYRGAFGRGNGSGYRGGFAGSQGRGENGYGRGRGRFSYRARGNGGRGIPQHRGDRAPAIDRPQNQQGDNQRLNVTTTTTDQQRRASSPAPTQSDQNKTTIEHLKRTLAMLSKTTN